MVWQQIGEILQQLLNLLRQYKCKNSIFFLVGN